MGKKGAKTGDLPNRLRTGSGKGLVPVSSIFTFLNNKIGQGDVRDGRLLRNDPSPPPFQKPWYSSSISLGFGFTIYRCTRKAFFLRLYIVLGFLLFLFSLDMFSNENVPGAFYLFILPVFGSGFELFTVRKTGVLRHTWWGGRRSYHKEYVASDSARAFTEPWSDTQSVAKGPGDLHLVGVRDGDRIWKVNVLPREKAIAQAATIERYLAARNELRKTWIVELAPPGRLAQGGQSSVPDVSPRNEEIAGGDVWSVRKGSNLSGVLALSNAVVLSGVAVLNLDAWFSGVVFFFAVAMFFLHVDHGIDVDRERGVVSKWIGLFGMRWRREYLLREKATVQLEMGIMNRFSFPSYRWFVFLVHEKYFRMFKGNKKNATIVAQNLMAFLQGKAISGSQPAKSASLKDLAISVTTAILLIVLFINIQYMF